ncbi:recombinase family protein [Rhodococcus sp. IEGM 1351]|uniref:recombinase family protein n=1 Tax=Rhodococcus sp. IEGM 1351 TaxID=3047089 RepID=UPI0024B66703|nr:recombinase family protein [Rhodococcus sp. IEGM 1351]MDI9936580.1 recombinase family protein [Rhodococcus sp. IEGM 1351]
MKNQTGTSATGLNAAIYCRASKDATGIGRSVEEQENVVREICHDKGWTVVEVISDNEFSASKYMRKQRPGFTKLCTSVINSLDVDVIVVYEQSRLTRKIEELVDFVGKASTYGTGIFVVGDYDVLEEDDPQWKQRGIYDEQHSILTSKRTRRALLANAKAGIPHGVPPFGYERATTKNEDGKVVNTLAIVESDAEIVRAMVAGVLEGLTLYEVARRWGDGRPARSVRKMLLTPSYAGIRRHRGHDYAGNWPAIITKDEQRRLEALLIDPRRKSTTGPKPRHLCSGIAVCGVCGTPVQHITQGNARSQSPQYRCPRRGCVARKAEMVDDLVVQSLLDHYAPEIARRRALEDALDAEATRAAAEARALRQRFDAEKQALAKRDDLEPEDFADMTALLAAKYRPQIKALEAKAGAVMTNPLLGKLDQWESFTIEQRRSVIRDALEIRIEKMDLGPKKDARVPVPESVTIIPRLEFRTDYMRNQKR